MDKDDHMDILHALDHWVTVTLREDVPSRMHLLEDDRVCVQLWEKSFSVYLHQRQVKVERRVSDALALALAEIEAFCRVL